MGACFNPIVGLIIIIVPHHYNHDHHRLRRRHQDHHHHRRRRNHDHHHDDHDHFPGCARVIPRERLGVRDQRGQQGGVYSIQVSHYLMKG